MTLQHPFIQWSMRYIPAIFFGLLGTICLVLSIFGHAMNIVVAIIFIAAILPVIFRHKWVHTILGSAFAVISGIYVLLFILVMITGKEDGQDARTLDMFAWGLLAIFALLCAISMIHVAQKQPLVQQN